MMDPYPFVLGNIVEDKLINCDWNGLDEDLNDLKNKIFEGKEIASPMLSSTLFDSPELMYNASKIWNRQFEISSDRFNTLITEKNTKINIGYFSADFRDHPLVINSQNARDYNKSKYEIFGFYLGNRHKENDRFHKE